MSLRVKIPKEGAARAEIKIDGENVFPSMRVVSISMAKLDMDNPMPVITLEVYADELEVETTEYITTELPMKKKDTDE